MILDPLENLPGDFDRLSARFENAKILHEAGVRIAFSQSDGFHLRKNRQLAGNAVAHGLPWEAGLAAITSGPAEIFGLGGSRGRIEKGQAADLVLWSGDPLEVTTVAENVGSRRAAPWRCARGRPNSGTAISSGSRPTARDDLPAPALAAPAATFACSRGGRGSAAVP